MFIVKLTIFMIIECFMLISLKNILGFAKIKGNVDIRFVNELNNIIKST